MNRSRLNLLVDLLAALNLLAMLATGYILRFPLPPTTNRTHELWGLSRHEWGSLHFWASTGLLAILAVHLVLHWEWIYTTIRRALWKANHSPPHRVRAAIFSFLTFSGLSVVFAVATHAGVRTIEPRHRLPEAHPSPLTQAVSRTHAVNFERDVAPIFTTACLGCHGPRKQKGGFRVDQKEDFFRNAGGEPLITPGDASRSRLLKIVTGKARGMKPIEEHQLSAPEVAVLEAWIRGGALWPNTP